MTGKDTVVQMKYLLIESPQTTAGHPRDREYHVVNRGACEYYLKNGTTDDTKKTVNHE